MYIIRKLESTLPCDVKEPFLQPFIWNVHDII